MTPSEFERQQTEIDRLKERMAEDIRDIKRIIHRAAPVGVVFGA